MASSYRNTNTTDNGLTSSTNYCYGVSAYDAGGSESNRCAQICATTRAVQVTGKLPDTGQTHKYLILIGEDADYTINPPFYSDNGDNTIEDHITGLVWQKQDYAGIHKSASEAVIYCENMTLAGQDDWRLPTRMELISFVNFSMLRISSLKPRFGIAPTIQGLSVIACGVPPEPGALYYWSSDPAIAACQWTVDVNRGYVGVVTGGTGNPLDTQGVCGFR